MKCTLALALGLVAVLATATPALVEPQFIVVSATQTVQSVSFARNTLAVTIVSDGPDTCHIRLFTDADTAGNATTSHGAIKSGEVVEFPFTPGQGSEAYVGPIRATSYKSMSVICPTGDTAAWRVWAK